MTPAELSPSREIYRLEVLASGDRRWKFWVHEDLTTDAAFALVIGRYGL